MTLLSLQRSRGARPWFGVWAVVVFGFRALIPTGYMVAGVDGQARLVMCPVGGMVVASSLSHGSVMDHSAHAALAAGHCPFALAGGVGLQAAAHEFLEPYYVVVHPARPFEAASIPVAPPSRYRAPRGPPSLA